MATSPTLSQLVIVGEADDDLITVSEAGGTITVVDTGTGGNGTPAGPCTAIPPDTVTCPLSPPGAGPLIAALSLLGADDDSYVNQNLAVPISQIIGEGGNDLIQSGPGDDFVTGGDGNDILETGPGDDELSWDAGTDQMNGGPGFDRADFANSFTPIAVSFDGLPNDGPPADGDNVLATEAATGTLFADVMRGDDAANEFDGDSGNDVIVGRGGADDLIGAAGNDQLTGGASPDGARDHLDCGAGVDLALRDTLDLVEPSCERRGADVIADQVKLRRDGKVRVLVACPPEEGATCSGTLALFSRGKRLSKSGKFTVGAGAAKSGRLKLRKGGLKALERAGGSLFVTVQAETAEPGGSSLSEARVLLTGHRSRPGPK